MYMLWSIEFISLCAKPDRTHVLCTWVLWVFAWASKPRVDKFTWKHLNFCDDSLFFVNNTQARRQGNSRGFTRTPFLASKRFYIHRSTVHFECPTVWNWSSSLDAIENHRRPHNQRGMRARISCLRRCDEGRNVTISAAQEFTNCLPSDVTTPAVLPTLVPSLLEIRSQLA